MQDGRNDGAEYLMISGIQHFVFCRRQWALIHVEKLWKENFLTMEGAYLHERVDDPSLREKRRDLISVHSLRVLSQDLRIQGVCDVVEFQRSPDGVNIPKWGDTYSVLPVEYKRGRPKRGKEDELQLLAQTVCLEEMLATEIVEGALFYHETRRREIIHFTTEMRSELRNIVLEMQNYMDRKYTPKVAKKPHCRKCSMRDFCLPELDGTTSVTKYIKDNLEESK